MMQSSDHTWKLVKGRTVARPPVRRLRGYAFDPSLSIRLDTAMVNEVVFRIPWEDAFDAGPDAEPEVAEGLRPGPIGEYIEVIDYDPASGCYYDPIDLNSPLVLGQDGLDPSEGNPQFHQQMVYAVAMTTVQNFEEALGRPALWSARRPEAGSRQPDEFVARLRIYPHALREANAYYSPSKKALLFGYFPAPESTPRNSSKDSHFPGGWVFNCLSHDVVAHETTHALLDGMHRRFIEPTHPDTLAFHEAFADLVALFQHFSFPEVLRHQISQTRGDLRSENLLGQLAQQFGTAIGQHGALRDAIGRIGERGVWEPRVPDPHAMLSTFEPHARGAILVAAVFDAFLAVYKRRVADLYRIATSGTGVLPEGEIHPDLVNRLADEAAKAAKHVLRMCIRALDYCPPVDITFGDYLRAVITADSDLVPQDRWGYRIAFIEAFRRRGIYPRSVRTLSIDSLRWPPASRGGQAHRITKLAAMVKNDLLEIRDYTGTREEYFLRSQRLAARLHAALHDHLSTELEEVIHEAVKFTSPAPEGTKTDDGGYPVFEVHSVRPAERVGASGGRLNHAVVVLTQSRTCPLDPELPDGTAFKFRGGCTLIFDLDTFELKYAVCKYINDDQRLGRQREYMRTGKMGDLRSTYFAGDPLGDMDEPFALLHRASDDESPTRGGAGGVA